MVISHKTRLLLFSMIGLGLACAKADFIQDSSSPEEETTTTIVGESNLEKNSTGTNTATDAVTDTDTVTNTATETQSVNVPGGLIGEGHFDADTFYNGKLQHYHEYDVTFDTTGVYLINAQGNPKSKDDTKDGDLLMYNEKGDIKLPGISKVLTKPFKVKLVNTASNLGGGLTINSNTYDNSNAGDLDEVTFEKKDIETLRLFYHADVLQRAKENQIKASTPGDVKSDTTNRNGALCVQILQNNQVQIESCIYWHADDA